MTRDQFVSLFFIALLIFVIHQIFLIFLPFFHAIFWAGILAFGFYPIFLGLKKILKTNDVIAAALMTVLIFIIVIIPVVLVALSMANQAVELYQEVANYVRDGKLASLIDQIRAHPAVQAFEEKVFIWQPLKENFSDWLLNLAKSIGNFGTVQAGHLTKNFAFVFLNIFLTFILLFVFLNDGEKIYRFIYRIAPLEEKNRKYIFRQINDTFSAVIRGQLLTSLTQAVTAGFVFWLLRLPVPIFFGAATFIATMIPVIGASFIWFPVAVYLVINGDYLRGGLLLIFGTFGISVVDNLMKPALIGEKTKLPYFLLFFGVMGGLRLYGIMGVFLAPVVLSLFFALIKIYQEKYLPHEN